MIHSYSKATSLVISAFVVASFACLVSCKKAKVASPEATLSFQSIIPKPVTDSLSGSAFELSKSTKIHVRVGAAAQEVLAIGQYLADRLNPATGFNLKAETTDKEASTGIYIQLASDPALGAEGYQLTITSELITLSANQPAGLFYGVQTLRQLLPAAIESSSVQKTSWEIATGTIHDYPQYAWRGSMLDVARHFFSVEDVKRYIDLIAAYKMNVLHLHLSDDQGWRIEIKSWPKLTTEGGKTQVGGEKGGFYTQEQYKDIVAYAQSRYITIVPEIDMPGHINSALVSYAELNSGIPLKMEPGKVRPTPGKVYTGIEVGFSTLHIKNERTFQFVDDVLRELSEITPGPYLHIGGDEAAVTKKEDYIAFINKFKEMVAAHGKQMIGWEEIAQGNIDSTTIAQYWHSDKYAQMASAKGAKLIMSPSVKVYLDMKYDSLTKLGLNWAAYIEVDDSYNWTPQTLSPELEQKNILGIETPLWSETIQTMDDIEFLLFPRLPGIAEVAWSPSAGRSWDAYKVRLGNQAKRFKAMDINYYRSTKVPWVD
ncbi:MAG: beta-N-acetylhexosaminidase [Azospira oryzae]|nr:MAG: beta-N-acetylhexosaminidase [Azospira oryzae]